MDRTVKKGISFAEFEIDPKTRRMRRGGQYLAVNAKAFDVLVYLIEHAERVVAKEEILNAVWEGQFVEEANLAVQVSSLRRTLGDRAADPRFIATIPGKGYRFIGDIDAQNEIVITDHRLSRILVEETITDDEAIAGERVAGRSFSDRPGMQILLIAGVSLAIVAGTLLAYRAYSGWSRGIASAIQKRVFPVSGGTPFYAGISRDGKSLAYVVYHSGQSSLRIGEIAGGNSIEVVPSSDRLFGSVVFAPDGKDLYFTFRDRSHARSTLTRVSIFGGPMQELIQGVDSSVTFSPDGKDLAFIRRDPEIEKSSIVVADAGTGQNERVLVTRENSENILGYGVSWSPDGAKIAFSGQIGSAHGSSIFAVNVTDGVVDKIADDVDDRIVNVSWSPDQNGLIVNRNTSNAAGDGQIWYVPSPHGKPENLSNDTLNYSLVSLSMSVDGQVAAVASRTDPEMSIAPDGDLASSRLIIRGSQSRREGNAGLFAAPNGKIVFCARSGGGRTIWEMDVDGGNQRQLTVSEGNSSDEQISVTSDDRFLVFQSDRSGSVQIWRADRDGANLTQLTKAGDNEEPAVTPDGRSVVYSSTRDGLSTLWQVSIEGGEPTQITTDFASWPAVSPDGRFVAYADGKPLVSVYNGISVISRGDGRRVKFFTVPPSAVLYNRLAWTPDQAAIVYKDDLQGLWQQELSGGNPQPLIGAEDFRFTHFNFSGRNIIYSGGTTKRDIVLFDARR